MKFEDGDHVRNSVEFARKQIAEVMLSDASFDKACTKTFAIIAVVLNDLHDTVKEIL